MVTPSMRLVAQGMLYACTPILYYEQWGLSVKREDLACPPPGPPFSKTRGVYSWCKKQTSEIIGVLDTRHSQGGHAVARACKILGKQCVVFYPNFKHDPGPRPPQVAAESLGAEILPLPAGRSAILYHAARKATTLRGGVIIPNALKLEESIEETAREVTRCDYDEVIVPVSSGTIAAGVVLGFVRRHRFPKFILHLGYSRSHDEVRKYVTQGVGSKTYIEIVDEGYAYKDVAREGPTPQWPCNEHYDLKAFRWYVANRKRFQGRRVLFWNIG